jgi:uncharacterized BrkB/YihY/UPF0761 family membrane protein
MQRKKERNTKIHTLPQPAILFDRKGYRGYNASIMKVDRLQEIISMLKSGDAPHALQRFVDLLLTPFRIITAALKKFLADDCFTKAASIAYTAILSLIPLLAVLFSALSLFSGGKSRKEEIFGRITRFMTEHNITVNIDPVLEAVTSLVNNAGKVGGIGAAIMVISATTMLRSLEKALNDIFRVHRLRPFYLRIIYFWAALTLGPIMLIAGTTAATKVSEILSSPSYHALSPSAGDLWIAGTRGSLKRVYSGKNGLTLKSDYRIDLDNQVSYRYDTEGRPVRDNRLHVDEITLAQLRFLDLDFAGPMGWAVTNRGIIFRTPDSGKNWDLVRYASLHMNAISMIDEKRGFIATQNGSILETVDGGLTWNRRQIAGITSTFSDIEFQGRLGLAVGSRGTLSRTIDGGESWKTRTLNPARSEKGPVNLNSVDIHPSGTALVAGDNGTILFSRNGGRTWISRSWGDVKYYSTLLVSGSEALVAGGGGTILKTDDLGKTWRRYRERSRGILGLSLIDNELWVTGKNGFIKHSPSGPEELRGREGNPFLFSLLNFLAPFAFIWILVLLAYTSMPNTRVPLRYAAGGAAFTGTVWVLLILLFIVFIRSFADSTFAIYGALAALPLFMIIVFASSIIMLYGAELSFVLMHPQMYRNLKASFSRLERLSLYTGLDILFRIYERFEFGRGHSDRNYLIRTTGATIESIDDLIHVFMENGLLLSENGVHFLPATSSEKVKLSTVMELMEGYTLAVPRAAKNRPLSGYLRQAFRELGKRQREIFGEDTLHDLMKGKKFHRTL